MESAFQFTNPSLREVEFSVNDGFNNQKEQKIKIPMHLSVNVKKAEDKNEASVDLLCEVGGKSEEYPFWIRAKEQANFRWEDDVNNETADQLLNINAPALLLSYLRPIVSQITSASQYGSYDIPFFNFTDKGNGE